MFPSFERVNISCRQKIVIQFKRPPCHNKTGFEQSLSCGVDPCFGSGPAVIAAAHVQKNIKKHQYIVRGIDDRARVAISFEDVQKCRDTMKNKGCVLSIVVLWRCNARKRKSSPTGTFPWRAKCTYLSQPIGALAQLCHVEQKSFDVPFYLAGCPYCLIDIEHVLIQNVITDVSRRTNPIDAKKTKKTIAAIRKVPQSPARHCAFLRCGIAFLGFHKGLRKASPIKEDVRPQNFSMLVYIPETLHCNRICFAFPGGGYIRFRPIQSCRSGKHLRFMLRKPKP